MALPRTSQTRSPNPIHQVSRPSLHDYGALPPAASERINLTSIREAMESRRVAREQTCDPGRWERLLNSGDVLLLWVDLPSEHLISLNPSGRAYVRYLGEYPQVPFDRAPGGKVHDTPKSVKRFLEAALIEIEQALKVETSKLVFYGGRAEEIWRASYDTFHGEYDEETRIAVIRQSHTRKISTENNIKFLEDRKSRIHRTIVACEDSKNCGLGLDFAPVSPTHSTKSSSFLDTPPLSPCHLSHNPHHPNFEGVKSTSPSNTTIKAAPPSSARIESFPRYLAASSGRERKKQKNRGKRSEGKRRTTHARA